MISPGDTVTIAGVYPTVCNPNRKWWQFWKPRHVADVSRLQQFTVMP